MLNINLLPPEYKKEIEYSKDNKGKVRKIGNVLLMLFMSLLLAVSGLYMLNLKANDSQVEIDSLNKEIAPLEKVEAEAKTFNDRLDTLKEIINGHLYWTKIYDQINGAKPAGVRVTRYSLSADPKKEQLLNGFAPTLDDIAAFRNRLEKANLVKAASLKTASYGELANQRGYLFSFGLTLEKNALLAKAGEKK